MNRLCCACAVALLLVLSPILVLAQKPASKPAAKPAASSSPQAMLEKLEKDGWEAFKNRDEKAFSALAAPGYTAVNADQQPPHDLQSTIQEMKNDVTVNSYELSDVKVTSLGPAAALVTYFVRTNLTFTNSKPQEVKLAVTDVWVKQGGQWKSIRYHESEIK